LEVIIPATGDEEMTTLGSQSFDLDNYIEHKHGAVAIWYDVYPPSCKIDINHPNFKKTIPTSGGFSLMELDVATTILSSVLEDLIDTKLAKEVLGAYTRFRISNPGQEMNDHNRRRKH